MVCAKSLRWRTFEKRQMERTGVDHGADEAEGIVYVKVGEYAGSFSHV